MILGGEPPPVCSPSLPKVRLEPLIQVKAMVQEDVKRQEAGWESVKGANGSEVRIVNDEQKNQHEEEEGQITSRQGSGFRRRFSAEAIRTHRSWPAQRLFSLPFPRAHFPPVHRG